MTILLGKPPHELVPPIVKNDAGKLVPLDPDEIIHKEANVCSIRKGKKIENHHCGQCSLQILICLLNLLFF
jgi:hypothetical protein